VAEKDNNATTKLEKKVTQMLTRWVGKAQESVAVFIQRQMQFTGWATIISWLMTSYWWHRGRGFSNGWQSNRVLQAAEAALYQALDYLYITRITLHGICYRKKSDVIQTKDACW